MVVIISAIVMPDVASSDSAPQRYCTDQGLFFSWTRYLGKVEAEFSGSTNKLVSLAGAPTLLGQNGSNSNITPDPEAQVWQHFN